MKNNSTPKKSYSNLRAWVMAIRPKTLLLGIAPIFVGIGFAVNHNLNEVNWTAASVCLVVSILLQIGSNLANDLFDFKKGADTDERLGPIRVTASNIISPKSMMIALILVIIASAILGTYLIMIGGLIIGLLGAAAIISAIAYTGGPYPLGYNGLGELFVFLFFGLAGVLGTTFLTIGYLPFISIYGAIAVGALSSNVLVVNNVRDIKEDQKTGKRTLAVKLGRNFGVFQYATGIFISTLIPVALYLNGITPFILLLLITVPFGILSTIKLQKNHDGKSLNSLLAKTALHTFLYSTLLTTILILNNF